MHTRLNLLEKLLDPDFVSTKKIECIKVLRGISGEGLKETKDFYEQVLHPVVVLKLSVKRERQVGNPFDDESPSKEEFENIMRMIRKMEQDIAELKRGKAKSEASVLFM